MIKYELNSDERSFDEKTKKKGIRVRRQFIEEFGWEDD